VASNLATPARAEAARRNGRRSRGPTTAEGKLRSSRNALRHGILSASLCAGESPEQGQAYEALLDDLRTELAPSSVLESLLVERIAATLWRVQRVLAFEVGSGLMRDGDSSAQWRIERCRVDDATKALLRALAPGDTLDLTMRYEAHLTREVSRLLAQLEQARRLCAVDGSCAQSN
jgi:hypothetical protein